MRISVPWAGLHRVPEWFMCRAVTTGVLIQPSVSGKTCSFRSQPAHAQLPCGQKDNPLIPWAAPRMLWSFHLPPLCFRQCCSVQGSKASLSQGWITSVKVYLEPSWPSTPALLSCIVPLSPSPSQSSGVPVVSSAVLKRMHWWISQVLLRQDSPGTLDHLASLIIIVLFWCAVQWSVQVHKLHRPFGNCWSVFSRITVIQTSCTCRLKSCNPRLRACTAVSVCQWLLNHTPESLQTLRLICTHSLAACQQVLHFQPWKYI